MVLKFHYKLEKKFYPVILMNSFLKNQPVVQFIQYEILKIRYQK